MCNVVQHQKLSWSKVVCVQEELERNEEKCFRLRIRNVNNSVVHVADFSPQWCQNGYMNRVRSKNKYVQGDGCWLQPCMFETFWHIVKDFHRQETFQIAVKGKLRLFLSQYREFCTVGFQQKTQSSNIYPCLLIRAAQYYKQCDIIMFITPMSIWIANKYIFFSELSLSLRLQLSQVRASRPVQVCVFDRIYYYHVEHTYMYWPQESVVVTAGTQMDFDSKLTRRDFI